MLWFLQHAINRWNTGVGDFLKLLGLSPQHFQGGAGWGIVMQLRPFFVAIAATLVPIFFLYSIAQEAVSIRDQITMDNIVKMFLRLGIAQWLVVYGIDLIEALFKSVGAIITFLNANTNLTQLTIAPEVEQMINEANIFDKILPFAILSVVILVVYVMAYILLYTVYFRFFKIYTAVILSPLAIAPIAGGTVGNTPRNFTRFIINTALEAVTMIIAIIIFTAITNSGAVAIEDTGNMWNLVLYMLQMLFGMCVTVGGVKAAESTTKNILGL